MPQSQWRFASHGTSLLGSKRLKQFAQSREQTALVGQDEGDAQRGTRARNSRLAQPPGKHSQGRIDVQK
jgi:hypothetical protein